MRAMAVLVVFLAHLQQHYFPYVELDGSPLLIASYSGMTIFFVLSGFVIHWNYGALFAAEWSWMACWKFFVARFSRLYPLHLAVTLFALMAGMYLNYGLFVQHIFMVQTWVHQGQLNMTYFNTWSISTEWFFYFTYAATYPLIALFGKSNGSMWLLAGVVCTALAVYWMAGPGLTVSDLWILYQGPYLRLCEFATGVVAAQIVITRRAQGRDVPSDVVLVLTIVLTMVFYHTSLGQITKINYLIAPMVAVALIVVSDCRSVFAEVLSARWLLWIGDRSYSIYLLEAVFLVESYRLETPLGYVFEPRRVFTWSGFFVGGMFSVFGFALVLVLSNFCWRYLELPARKALKQALTSSVGSSGRSQTV